MRLMTDSCSRRMGRGPGGGVDERIAVAMEFADKVYRDQVRR